MNWFENQRIEWVLQSIRIYGFINREHLQKKFGISQVQASKDLTKITRLYNKVIKYNLNTKRYEYIP